MAESGGGAWFATGSGNARGCKDGLDRLAKHVLCYFYRTRIFGRRRVPKIADGLSIFIYFYLEAGRAIPGDGPVSPWRWPRSPRHFLFSVEEIPHQNMNTRAIKVVLCWGVGLAHLLGGDSYDLGVRLRFALGSLASGFPPIQNISLSRRFDRIKISLYFSIA